PGQVLEDRVAIAEIIHPERLVGPDRDGRLERGDALDPVEPMVASKAGPARPADQAARGPGLDLDPTRSCQPGGPCSRCASKSPIDQAPDRPAEREPGLLGHANAPHNQGTSFGPRQKYAPDGGRLRGSKVNCTWSKYLR